MFQISERSVTRISLAASQTCWMAAALLKHLRIAEHRAVVLHGVLHAAAQFRGGRAAVGVAQRSRRATACSPASCGSSAWELPGFDGFGAAMAGRPAEHDEIDQRVGAQPVRAMHAGAGRLAERHQAGHRRVEIVSAAG